MAPFEISALAAAMLEDMLDALDANDAPPPTKRKEAGHAQCAEN